MLSAAFPLLLLAPLPAQYALLRIMLPPLAVAALGDSVSPCREQSCVQSGPVFSHDQEKLGQSVCDSSHGVA